MNIHIEAQGRFSASKKPSYTRKLLIIPLGGAGRQSPSIYQQLKTRH
ncbi:hypothetical protein LC085_00365 [Bacillus tianshenii]|nr:hypothetical protein [Bacillus tianshenii]MCA1318348.1 hypothetical protein [Bacillus tianshenii]